MTGQITGIFGQWIWPLLQLIIGLGVVILVHELGHFLVAKAVGIKVERFAIGFGPRLVGFTGGETEYCINVLPLGGYVKMLGQEDFAPMDQSQQRDPRSFTAKSVGARFLVISAGVVMNIILAALLFIVIIGLVGKEFMAPVVGETVRGYPAATAEISWIDESPEDGHERGLQPGDRIVKIDGNEVTRFDSVFVEGAFAGRDRTFEFTFERTVDGRTYTGIAEMGVRRLPDGTRMGFGIEPAADNVFARVRNYRTIEDFQPGDRVVAVGGQPVEHQWDIKRIVETLDGRRTTVTVERPAEADDDAETVELEVLPTPRLREGVVFLEDGTAVEAVRMERYEENGERFIRLFYEDERQEEFAEDQLAGGIHMELLDVAGMIPRIRAQAVEEGSPADRAGLEAGDVILSYADRTTPTLNEFRGITDDKVRTETTIVVLRDGRTVGPLKITPSRRHDQALVGISMGVDAEHTMVASIRSESPAAGAGIRRGDEITAVADEPVGDWPELLQALADHAGESVMLTVRRGDEELELEVALPAEKFDPDHYSFDLFPGPMRFEPLTVLIRKTNPLAAVTWGANETWFHVRSTLATLGGLISGGLSPEMVRGPVGIGQIAIEVGRESVMDLVYLMALVSSAVAVINFLPFPVLDGGHAVFLLIEKIRGKPVPLKVANAIQMVGLALILLLFVLITWQDLARIIRGLW